MGAERVQTRYPETMERMTVVMDPELGTIAATIDADGSVLSTHVDDLPATNVQRYKVAADLAATELAHLYAEAHPEHPPWLEQRMWDACLWEGGA